MARDDTGIGNGFGRDPLELVERLVRVIGGQTEALFDYHDFGFSRCVIRDHIARVADGLSALRKAGSRPLIDLRAIEGARGSRTSAWNHRQSFLHAAGASMVMERFREAIHPADLPRAYAAIALQEFQADLLDDVIDADGYTVEEAEAIYRHCLGPMTSAAFDMDAFRSTLRGLVRAGQDASIEMMASITAGLHRILRTAPSWAAVAPVLAAANESVAVSQALTVYQKQPTVDIRALRRGASRLPSPDPDLTWEERLACAVAHGKCLTLVSMCFTREPLRGEALEAHLKAWAYYDLLISHLNHLVDLPEDAAAGVTNFALLWMKEADVLDATDVRTRPPVVTLSDYESFLARTAYLARRALRAARSVSDDTDLFHPFITVMIPAVMLYEPGGNGEELLHTFLRFLAPMIRRELMRDDPFA